MTVVNNFVGRKAKRKRPKAEVQQNSSRKINHRGSAFHFDLCFPNRNPVLPLDNLCRAIAPGSHPQDPAQSFRPDHSSNAPPALEFPLSTPVHAPSPAHKLIPRVQSAEFGPRNTRKGAKCCGRTGEAFTAARRTCQGLRGVARITA